MISRRLLLVGGAALTATPFVARAQSAPLALAGTMEQGSLIVGRTQPGAQVTFNHAILNISPEGIFACGLQWNSTGSVCLSVRLSDGTSKMQRIEPILRTYAIESVEGLPPETVTPPPDALERIGVEHAKISEARKTDSDAIWFADPFDWPARGIVSGVFGSQRIDNGMPTSPHMGVDIANAEGTPIHAPADGTVLLCDDYYLEGGLTLLDHGHGVTTAYLHQSRRMVTPGDVVRRGQVIGLIGMTGRATGPHLHWSLNWFQVRLDPSRSTRTSAPLAF